MFMKIANRSCVKDKLVQLAQHTTGNFIVQRIAERAAAQRCDQIISNIIDALAPNLSLFAGTFGHLLKLFFNTDVDTKTDRPGVILKLVELGLKNPELQPTLFESIEKVTYFCHLSGRYIEGDCSSGDARRRNSSR